MESILIILLSLVWLVVGIKTWGFVLTDIVDPPTGRSAKYDVVASCIVGLVMWPVVYIFFMLTIAAVALRDPLTDVKDSIIVYWEQ